MLCIADNKLGRPLPFQPNTPLAAIEPISWQYLGAQHLIGHEIVVVHSAVSWLGSKVP